MCNTAINWTYSLNFLSYLIEIEISKTEIPG